MKKYQDKINKTTGLQDLIDTMNDIAEEIGPELKLSQVIDLAMLPTFGGADIQKTSEVWSWDKKNILVDGSEGWETEPRCNKCGEAIFHCQHDQE